MEFKRYWMNLDVSDKQMLADKAGTTPEYLRLIAYGHNRPSPELALKIQQATDHRVQATTLVFGEALEEVRDAEAREGDGPP